MGRARNAAATLVARSTSRAPIDQGALGAPASASPVGCPGIEVEKQPFARLVARTGSIEAQVIAIYDRLCVGRECAGVEESRRFLIDDPRASRDHFEIHVDPRRGLAYVVDTSTNGTRLNGVRIERAVPVMLGPGDVLTVGVADFEFQSEFVSNPDAPSGRQTTAQVTNATFVMVVGDIVDFSSSSHATPSRLVMESLEVLLAEFRSLLTDYHGTLSNFVGDAFFAIWEFDSDVRAVHHALDFVTAAAARVADVAPRLALRAVEGQPIRLGWGVAHGDAAVGSLTGVLLGVVGDATNLAFRLSGIAGRQGHSTVLVTDALCQLVGDRYKFEDLEYVRLKGRPEVEPVRGLRLRLAPEPDG